MLLVIGNRSDPLDVLQLFERRPGFDVGDHVADPVFDDFAGVGAGLHRVEGFVGHQLRFITGLDCCALERSAEAVSV